MRTLLAVLFLSRAIVANAQNADLILINGKVWTENPAQTEAQAIAARFGRIVSVGSNSEALKQKGPSTRVIDLQGKRVLPGFIDSHVHLQDGGQSLSDVQLGSCKSQAEFRERIRAFAAKLPAGQWITSGNWDHENWAPAVLPTRQLIDEAAGDHPVFVSRLDGHMALANTIALKKAGITRDTPDPAGGTIVHDESGEPTGILKDAAMGRVDAQIPALTREQILKAIKDAMRYAAERGVTGVTDMSAGPDTLAGYQELLNRGELTLRISGHQPLQSWRRLAGVGVHAGFGGEMLRIGGLKGFADGSLGSTTAWLFDPYLDAPSTSGLAGAEMHPETAMTNNILGADKAGLQIAVHAIGDRANERILTFFEEAIRKNGPRDRRFRIEHAQHLRAQDIPRFGQLKVIASMQPYHCIDDGRWAEKRIGPERAKGTYAFKTLLQTGATLAFGSDWPVAPMDPLMGIYAAVTRRTLDGKHPNGWVPEQKITVAQAIHAYTMGSAFACFADKDRGSLQVGKLADMVVLDRDILAIDPVGIAQAKVDMTLVGGKVVFERR